ncbi:MAG: DUF2231 domain-containing protein [Betaproteobacteria bacterium]|nr:DUF2231 domain-containing protein [Betaproteobacteria bacterium]
MPDIVPNWHPAAVHFPIALVFTATLLLLAARILPGTQAAGVAGRLLLPLAAFSALVAAGFGWQAFATVEHDAAGHVVMLRHRDWALGATAALVLLAGWDLARQRRGYPVHAGLPAALLVVSGAFAVTGWLGGEMVYRHAVGVIRPAPAPLPPALAQPQATPEAAAPANEAVPAESGKVHIHRDGSRHSH